MLPGDPFATARREFVKQCLWVLGGWALHLWPATQSGKKGSSLSFGIACTRSVCSVRTSKSWAAWKYAARACKALHCTVRSILGHWVFTQFRNCKYAVRLAAQQSLTTSFGRR